MVKALDPGELTDILNGDAETLFYRFERICGLLACIREQYDNTSAPGKAPTDPDVAALEDEYDALFDEILDRIGNKNKKDFEDYAIYQEGWDRHMARVAGAFGMSEPATGIDWVVWKADLQTKTDGMLTLLGVAV